MTRQPIHSDEGGYLASAPYSQAMVGAGLVFTAGAIGLDPATGSLVEGGLAPETTQAISNLRSVLAAAGTDLAGVLKCTVFLVDDADFAPFNEVYRAAFPEPFPARTTVVVRSLPRGALIEIECVALAPKPS